jgi:glyoxylase-like metal-dependent hydrolase (beta-lactamase superfamily II)
VAERTFTVDEVAAGTWRIDDGLANFYLRKENGSGLLIDGGCRGSARGLARALRLAGLAVEDVVAVLLTHSHIDHVGVAERVRVRSQSPVYLHADDHVMARCATPGLLGAVKTRLGMDWGPRVAWGLLKGHCLPYPVVRELTPVADGEVLDLPGKPRVIWMPGHTMGSCAFLFEGISTLFSGDALVTMAGRDGAVRCLASPAAYDDDPVAALESVERLVDLQAGLVLPGHGPDFSDGLSVAVAQARAAGV